jgi:glucosyl-3-phosphoglycerate synthase
MLPDVEHWLQRRTSAAQDWPVELLEEAKHHSGLTVSVVLPARNEEATVGSIVETIVTHLVEGRRIVDEVLVVDSRSTDRTAEIAEAAGARVVHQDAVLPDSGRLDGKGDVLWKGVAATSGDIVVFNDSDVTNHTPEFVTGLLGPLLTDPEVLFVKGFYDRPLMSAGGSAQAGGGGRVTELVARPILSARWPRLAAVEQPLGGEYAGRRELFEQIPFVTGYGVEIGMLIDTYQLRGLESIAQVDLGTRVHSHQDTQALGRMAGQIMWTEWTRLVRYGRVSSRFQLSPRLVQFGRDADGAPMASEVDISVAERPRLLDVPEYIAGRNRG